MIRSENTRTHRRHPRRGLGRAAAGILIGLLVAPALAGERRPAPERQAASPFLLASTDVSIAVTGPVAHATVTQRWHNPNDRPVDGLYIFPLPENAAVTGMKLVIGARVIESKMMRREQARAVYEQARREGRIAGLLDQERPNVFAQQVANIMPGVAIDVVLEFDDEVICEAGECRYDMPTVVGPRFVPAHQTDPGRIDPPIVAPGGSTGQRLSFEMTIDAGVEIRSIHSPSHALVIERDGPARARVSLPGEAAARLDRDVSIRWSTGGERPEVGLLAWRDPDEHGDAGVFTLIVEPPRRVADDQAAPRELVFVLDCSGSMSGVPISAAKEVVRRALRAARPQDTFQIIRFSESASGLGPAPLRPTPENLERALAYLDGLRGQGGTRMIEGIRAALGRPRDPERLRIVAFLTDGYIGNETEILAETRRLIGDARLFSFGIGSSVNRYLLEELAAAGRGAAAFLGPREAPEQMVRRFVERIETPVLTDIRITWEDLDVFDLEPPLVPDLFAGQPLVLHGRYRTPASGVVIVEGTERGRRVSFRRVVTLLDRASDHEALARLWARARAGRLQRQLSRGDQPALREQIIELGLAYRLMTPFTSLVAVDSAVSNFTGGSVPVEVPVEMPDGVSYEGVFGRGAVAAAPPRVAQKSFATRELGAPPARDEMRRKVPGAGPDVEVVLGDPAPTAEPERTREAAFEQVSLVAASGARISVNASGEVWREEGRRRRLVRVLDPAQLARLRDAISVAAGRFGPQPIEGARLFLRANGRTLAAPLPPGGPLADLARLIRDAAAS